MVASLRSDRFPAFVSQCFTRFYRHLELFSSLFFLFRIGDAVDFAIDGSSEFVLKVHRRDWRADAYAHRLQWGDAWIGSLEDATVPSGPSLWSQRSQSLPAKAPEFQRCADRELGPKQ